MDHSKILDLQNEINIFKKTGSNAQKQDSGLFDNLLRAGLLAERDIQIFRSRLFYSKTFDKEIIVEGELGYLRGSSLLHKEEIEIKPEDMEAVHVMNRLSGGVERIDFFFKAEKCTGEPRNTEPHKCDGLGWFEIEKLPENMVPYVRQAIICMHKGDFYSEFGWEK